MLSIVSGNVEILQLEEEFTCIYTNDMKGGNLDS